MRRASDEEMGQINLKPVEPALDARALDELIALWLADCESRIATDTVQGYAYKIEHFRTWWAQVGPEQDWKLRKRDLVVFERDLQQIRSRRGNVLTYHTRHDVLRRLAAMFRWAHREGYTEAANYSAWVPEADGRPPVRQAAGLDALRSLFEASGRSPYPARDRAILAVLIGTGMRRGECASLRVEDLQMHADGSGVARVRGKRTRANRTGERQVAFDAVTGRQLAHYLDASGLRSGSLWPGTRGPITAQGVYLVVKRCVREAGLEGVIRGPHDLRRTFATLLTRHARDQLIDGDLIRRQMGHTTYRMTSQYSLLDVEDIRDTLVSPMSMLGDDEEEGK